MVEITAIHAKRYFESFYIIALSAYTKASKTDGKRQSNEGHKTSPIMCVNM